MFTLKCMKLCSRRVLSARGLIHSMGDKKKLEKKRKIDVCFTTLFQGFYVTMISGAL